MKTPMIFRLRPPVLAAALLAVFTWGLCPVACADAAAAPKDFRGIPWGDGLENFGQSLETLGPFTEGVTGTHE